MTDEPLPPTRSNLSITVTEYPFEPSRIAADKPPSPAPITTADDLVGEITGILRFGSKRVMLN